jgi:dipeptide/tripeptide permease
MALCRLPVETRAQMDSQACHRTLQIIFASTNVIVAGALGMGQRASFGLGQFNSFWSYTTPIIGAIIADEYLGRFNTIFVAIAFSILGHIFLIISAVPVVLTSGKAIAPFIIGLILLGFGTGAFKANISPLIAEQYRATKLRVIVEKKTGERVIRDPNITLSRIFLVSHCASFLQSQHTLQQLIERRKSIFICSSTRVRLLVKSPWFMWRNTSGECARA